MLHYFPFGIIIHKSFLGKVNTLFPRVHAKHMRVYLSYFELLAKLTQRKDGITIAHTNWDKNLEVFGKRMHESQLLKKKNNNMNFAIWIKLFAGNGCILDCSAQSCNYCVPKIARCVFYRPWTVPIRNKILTQKSKFVQKQNFVANFGQFSCVHP